MCTIGKNAAARYAAGEICDARVTGQNSGPDSRGKSGEILLGDFGGAPAGARPRPDGVQHTPEGYAHGGRPRPQGAPGRAGGVRRPPDTGSGRAGAAEDLTRGRARALAIAAAGLSR